MFNGVQTFDFCLRVEYDELKQMTFTFVNMEATLGGLENSIYSERKKEKTHGSGIKT
jgi:hypothetical protein